MSAWLTDKARVDYNVDDHIKWCRYVIAQDVEALLKCGLDKGLEEHMRWWQNELDTLLKEKG